MSSQPAGEEPSEPWYRVPMPSPGGYTADELDRCGELPPHTELIDASLVFSLFAGDVQALVRSALDRYRGEASPVEAEEERRPGVMIKLGHADPHSDILSVQVQAADAEWCSWFPPAAVALVIEVAPAGESSRSAERARAHLATGVPLFWSFEEDADATVVHVHELANDARSARPTVLRDRLQAARPFEVDFDLNRIRPVRS